MRCCHDPKSTLSTMQTLYIRADLFSFYSQKCRVCGGYTVPTYTVGESIALAKAGRLIGGKA